MVNSRFENSEVRPGVMATQHFKRNLLLNLYREEKISLVCFLLLHKRDKGYLHRPGNSIQPEAIPFTLLQEIFATSEDNWVCQNFWVIRSRGPRCFFLTSSFPWWFILGYWVQFPCYTVGPCCLSILYIMVSIC